MGNYPFELFDASMQYKLSYNFQIIQSHLHVIWSLSLHVNFDLLV